MKRATVALACLAALSAAHAAPRTPDQSVRGDQEDRAGDLGIWSDPEFQKRFLGSYGANADIEPTVTTVEREQMQKILQLMGTDQEAAAALIEKLLDKGQASSAVFDFTLANIRFQQEDFPRATTAYEAAIRKFPSFMRAYRNLGLIQVREGKFPVAIKSLSRVVELGGSDGLTWGLLGFAYGSTGQHLSAESAYRSAVLLQPDVIDWKLGLTQSALRQEKYGETVTLCQELLARAPDRAEFWMLQANAYIGLGQPLRAAENLEMVARMGKGTPQSQRTLGDIYVNQGLMELAARAYAAGFALDPVAGLEDTLKRVEALAQRGALDPARTVLAEVRAAGGEGDAEARRRMLKLEARIAVAEGTDAAAVGVLEECVALDPLDGEALMLLGQHYEKAGDSERAIFYYERAQSLEKYEAESKIRLARLYVDASRYAEAVPLLRRAQEIDPREDVARYLEQVERAARANR